MGDGRYLRDTIMLDIENILQDGINHNEALNIDGRSHISFDHCSYYGPVMCVKGCAGYWTGGDRTEVLAE